MQFRLWTVAVSIGGLGLMAGCPNGVNYGLESNPGAESYYEVIADGTYVGTASDSYQLWYGGELYRQDSGGGQTGATFWNGAVQKDAGGALQIGDVEQLDNGIFRASRTVYDVAFDDWACEISYDVTAQLDTIPMSGTEYITFYENSDGSVTMFDTLELISLDAFDGGAWAIHGSSSGTLAPSYGNENPPDDILDHKSGKIVIEDSSAR